MAGAVVVFGGTFDPVHTGHLIIAEHAADALACQAVTWMPAGVPPHKRGVQVSAAADRLAMLHRAVDGNERFQVSDFELNRPAASYTIDTVRHLRAAGAPEVILLIGADSLRDLPSWMEPEALVTEARLLVVPRPGIRPDDTPFAERVEWLAAPLMQISASVIRARVRRGASIRYLVPDPVADYIASHDLYRRP